MRKLLIVVATSLLAVQMAYAADDCEAKATAKKLAGAAKTSFMKKCTTDAKVADVTATCNATAAEKKLAGAAKNSFLKKCVADAK